MATLHGQFQLLAKDAFDDVYHACTSKKASTTTGNIECAVANQRAITTVNEVEVIVVRMLLDENPPGRSSG